MQDTNATKSKYIIFQIPFLPIDRYLTKYFPYRLPISELADQHDIDEIYCNYLFNDKIVGLPKGHNPCSNLTNCIEELKRVLANEEKISLDEFYWDEYIVLVFYILAFRELYKSEKAEVLKYQNEILNILNAIYLLKEAESHSEPSPMMVSLSGPSIKCNFDFRLSVDISEIKQILIDQAKKIPLFDFLPKIGKLLSVDVKLAELLKLREYLLSFSGDYPDFIEMRGTTLLVNYLRSRSDNRKPPLNITSNEIRFIIRTYKAVKLTGYSPLNNNDINAFRNSYNRVVARLTH